MIGPKVIIPLIANNMTGTSVLTSLALDLRVLHAFSIQAVWTGTPVGTFSIQASLDYTETPAGQILNAGDWVDIGATLVAPAGSASSAILDGALTGLPYIRVVYTNSASVGSLFVEGFAK